MKTMHLNEARAIAIHEMGHLLGMACNGGIGKPDGTPYYYDETQTGALDENIVRHLGNHCKFNYKLTPDGKSSAGCVMFGGTTVNNIDMFCEDCSNCLRKMDYTDGFTNSFE